MRNGTPEEMQASLRREQGWWRGLCPGCNSRAPVVRGLGAVGNVKSTGGLRTGSISRRRKTVFCGHVGSPAILRVSLGPVKGCCALEVALQVFPPQPSSLASVRITLVKLCPLGPLTASSAGPNSPCSGLVTFVEHFILISSLRSPLAFSFPFISLIVLSVLSIQSSGSTSSPTKSVPQGSALSSLSSPFLFRLIHFYHFPEGFLEGEPFKG